MGFADSYGIRYMISVRKCIDSFISMKGHSLSVAFVQLMCKGETISIIADFVNLRKPRILRNVSNIFLGNLES